MTATALPFVSIVVVNRDGRAFLDECLSSLVAQSYPKCKTEIIFVDNASNDDSAAFVRNRFPEIHVLALDNNFGFAGGNNIAFGMGRGEWFALINSDASADSDWLKESLYAGMAAPDIGGVAGHLTFRDNPKYINSTGLELYRDGRAGDRDLLRLESQVERRCGEVFGGCGAALVLRRELVDEIRGFDEKLFLYYEDFELAWRARQLNWRFVYTAQAKVRHAFGGSVGVASATQVRFVERNRAIVNIMYSPIWLATMTCLGMCARLMRLMLRATIRSELSAAHFMGMCRSVIEVALRLPDLAWKRLSCPGSPAIYRKWSRPLPR